MTLVALSRDAATLTVTAASPLAAVAALRVSVAGLRLAGAPTAACTQGVAGGGVDVLLELPAPPATGTSVSIACAVVIAT
jgi:hypothetical protein